MRSTPRSLTVFADSREKTPFLFPATLKWYQPGSDPRILPVRVQTKALKTGDYYVKGHEHICRFERKASIRELHTNLFTKDRGRFTRALTRLSKECKVPYLVIEGGPGIFDRPNRHVPYPMAVLDALLAITIDLGIYVWWVGSGHTRRSRTRIGEELLRISLAHTYASPFIGVVL